MVRSRVDEIERSLFSLSNTVSHLSKPGDSLHAVCDPALEGLHEERHDAVVPGNVDPCTISDIKQSLTALNQTVSRVEGDLAGVASQAQLDAFKEKFDHVETIIATLTASMAELGAALESKESSEEEDGVVPGRFSERLDHTDKRLLVPSKSLVRRTQASVSSTTGTDRRFVVPEAPSDGVPTDAWHEPDDHRVTPTNLNHAVLRLIKRVEASEACIVSLLRSSTPRGRSEAAPVEEGNPGSLKVTDGSGAAAPVDQQCSSKLLARIVSAEASIAALAGLSKKEREATKKITHALDNLTQEVDVHKWQLGDLRKEMSALNIPGLGCESHERTPSADKETNPVGSRSQGSFGATSSKVERAVERLDRLSALDGRVTTLHRETSDRLDLHGDEILRIDEAVRDLLLDRVAGRAEGLDATVANATVEAPGLRVTGSHRDGVNLSLTASATKPPLVSPARVACTARDELRRPMEVAETPALVGASAEHRHCS